MEAHRPARPHPPPQPLHLRRRNTRSRLNSYTPDTHIIFLDGQWGQWLIRFRRDFVVDPEGEAVNLWLGLVALAVLYNIWSVILRIAFAEMRQQFVPRVTLISLDIVADLLFIIDIFIQFRMGYLEDGILVQDPLKLADNYVNGRRLTFFRDVAAALPLPSFFLILSDGVCYPMCRLPKLMKYHTMVNFISTWDMKTNNPNIHRACKLLVYLATTIHWIGCFYYIISETEGHGSNEWVIQNSKDGQPHPFSRKYLCAIYWSTMTLTTIGETWGSPSTDLEYIFTGFTFLIGVFMFATVVGNVGDVISNMNAARVEFQQKMDIIKFYMTHHNIPDDVQNRVKKWAEYSWNRTQAMDDQSMLDILPFRLRAEIAQHVHLDTLQKVKIFEECEKGLLLELVVRLRSQIYSPGDYICRKGEIGREMYIINHGKVEVLIPNNFGEPTVVANLCEGNYFGEISLLRLADGCNRRNADVRSVGYSELLVLSKRDLIQALVEYPEARAALERQAMDRMRRIREEQQLHVINPELLGQDSDPEEERRTSQKAKAKEREMSELRHILNQLKAFDSRATKSRMEQLEEKCKRLQEQLAHKDRLLQRSRSRSSRQSRANSRQRTLPDASHGKDRRVNGAMNGGESEDLSEDSDSTFPDDTSDICKVDDIMSDMLNCENQINGHTSSETNHVISPTEQDGTAVGTSKSSERTRGVRPHLDEGLVIPGIAINDVISQEPCVRRLNDVNHCSQTVPSASSASSDFPSVSSLSSGLSLSSTTQEALDSPTIVDWSLATPDNSFSISDMDLSEYGSDITDCGSDYGSE